MCLGQRLVLCRFFAFFLLGNGNIVSGLYALRLDVLFGLLVHLRFDPGGSLDVVIVLEELVKGVETDPYIVDADRAVVVEVQSEPVVLN